MIYLNENDPSAAAWLRELIKQGHLPPGDVDDRSIVDVKPGDLEGYTECHFFAGIGGWPLALQLARQAGARLPENVWTGSAPCQPFSNAGQQKGLGDERHLWPYFYDLIRQRLPAAVFGEQVASKAAEPWLDHVSTDLEALGFAFAACAFPAASVGAPHIRDRTYWVGYANDTGLEGFRGRHQAEAGYRTSAPGSTAEAGQPMRLADDSRDGRRQEREDGRGELAGDRAQGIAAGLGAGGGDCRPGPTNGFWGTADWLFCRDGKWRPVESGIEPLAHGVPARVVRLRGYGNAIVIPEAVEFILAADEGRRLGVEALV